MENGFITLQRRLLKWQWHDDPNTGWLWVNLLLMANYEPCKWHGATIDRGQLATSIHDLSEQTGISNRSVRTSLSRLEKDGCIIKKTTNKNTIITICKYDSYQRAENEIDNQTTSERQTTDNQSTINRQQWNNNNKNNKNNNKKESTLKSTKEKDFSLSQPQEELCDSNVNVSTPPAPSTPNTAANDVDARRKAFAETIKPYVQTYGRDMCNDFYAYWTEMSAKGRKMRFEKERTWSLPRRLATWYGNDFGKKKELPPEIQATLPSLFDDVSSSDDEAKAIEEMTKDLTSRYTIKGKNDEMYCSESDAMYGDHPLSTVIEVETERIKKQFKQQRQ